MQLLALAILAAIETQHASAVTSNASRVNQERMGPLLRVAKKLEAAWISGVSLIEFRQLSRDLSAEVSILEGVARSRGDRAFLSTVKDASLAFQAAALLWGAGLDRMERASGVDAVREAYRTSGEGMTPSTRYTSMIDTGIESVKVASALFEGKSAEAQRLRDNAGPTQRKAGADLQRRARLMVQAEHEAHLLAEEQKARAARVEEMAALGERLRSGDVLVRRSAAERCAAAEPPCVVHGERLVDLLKDDDWDTRLAAASALGRLGEQGEPYLDALRAAAGDPDRRIMFRAQSAVGAIQKAVGGRH